MKRRTIKRAVWLLAATLAAGMGLHGAPAAAQDGKWRMAKPLLAPQGEVVSVAIGKKWYVFGGYDGANVQARGIVNVYDASTDTWTEKKNMQIPAHHASAVEVNGKIYVFGGFVGRPGTKVWQPI
jgi:N-acetylneuraminic acid mutarotase